MLTCTHLCVRLVVVQPHGGEVGDGTDYVVAPAQLVAVPAAACCRIQVRRSRLHACWLLCAQPGTDRKARAGAHEARSRRRVRFQLPQHRVTSSPVISIASRSKPVASRGAYARLRAWASGYAPSSAGIRRRRAIHVPVSGCFDLPYRNVHLSQMSQLWCCCERRFLLVPTCCFVSITAGPAPGAPVFLHF